MLRHARYAPLTLFQRAVRMRNPAFATEMENRRPREQTWRGEMGGAKEDKYLDRRDFLAATGSVLASLGAWDRLGQAQPQPGRRRHLKARR